MTLVFTLYPNMLSCVFFSDFDSYLCLQIVCNYYGKAIALPIYIYLALIYQFNSSGSSCGWLLPRWFNINDGIFDIFSATQNNETFFKLFVLKPMSNLVLDIFQLIHPIFHKRGFNESF